MKNFIIILLIILFHNTHAHNQITPKLILNLLDDKNYLIKKEQLEISNFEAVYLANKGNFDLKLDLNFTSVDKSPNFSEFSGQLKQPLPFLGVELWGGIKSNQGNIPSYWDGGATSEEGEYSLGIKLPLLNGFLIDKNRFLLKKSSYQLEKSKIEYSQKFLDHYFNIIEKFMEWYVSDKKKDIYLNLYNLAASRQQLIQKKTKKGALSELDLLDNQNLVLVRKSLLENTILKNQIDKRNFELIFNPTSQIEISDNAKPLLDILKIDSNVNWFELAIANRGDLKSFEFLQREKELNIQLQKQQRLPELNLEAEYTNPRSDVEFNYEAQEDTKVALTFSMPLWQRKASGDIQKAKTDLELAQLSQNFKIQKIKISLKNLVEAIKTLESRLILANEEVTNTEKLHKAEQKKMLEGLSSLINLNIREQAIAEAQLRQIQIEADLIKLKIELMVSSGVAPSF